MTAFEVVITLGRPFDVQIRNHDNERRYASFGESTIAITIPFADRASAEAAQREISVSVRQVRDAGGEDYRTVVAGEALVAGHAFQAPPADWNWGDHCVWFAPTPPVPLHPVTCHRSRQEHADA